MSNQVCHWRVVATTTILTRAFAAVTAWAQIGGGSIVGVISDQSRAVIPKAVVKITNVHTEPLLSG
jgi:hypothetical protein